MTTVNQVTPVTIPELTAAAALTGNEVLPVSQGGAAVKVAVSSLPQGMTAGVVTYGNTGGTPFPNYRTLTAGSNITITDNGAGGSLIISSSGGGGGGGAVDSVNGQTGVVVLDTGDISEAANLNYVSDAQLTVLGNTSGTNTGDQTSVSGNAGTATALQTARAINGVSFDGTAAITVTAAAGTLTGTTLNATVVTSSLTSVGTIATGVWNGTAVTPTYGGRNLVSEVTGTSQSAAVNTKYIANNAALVTITIPTTAALGDEVEVIGKGAGGWKIAQNASELIHFGNQDTTTGTGGSIASTNRYDSIKIVCTVADTEWTVVSSQGNMTIV